MRTLRGGAFAILQGDRSQAGRRAGVACSRYDVGRPNGLEVNPRGQGPRAEANAARRLPHVSRAVRAA